MELRAMEVANAKRRAFRIILITPDVRNVLTTDNDWRRLTARDHGTMIPERVSCRLVRKRRR